MIDWRRLVGQLVRLPDGHCGVILYQVDGDRYTMRFGTGQRMAYELSDLKK